MGPGDFAAFAAEALGHARPERVARGVHQHDLALVGGGFAVAEQPDVGADAGVVKNLLGQGDDGFDPVVFQNPAADFRLARARAAGEKRRTVEDDADVAWRFLRVVHPGDEVLQEKHLAIRPARQPGSEASGEAPRRLGSDGLIVLAPLVAIGRIHELEIEAHLRELVVGEGAAELDVFRIPALGLHDQHVGAGDGPCERDSNPFAAQVVPLLQAKLSPGQ